MLIWTLFYIQWWDNYTLWKSTHAQIINFCSGQPYSVWFKQMWLHVEQQKLINRFCAHETNFTNNQIILSWQCLSFHRCEKKIRSKHMLSLDSIANTSIEEQAKFSIHVMNMLRCKIKFNRTVSVNYIIQTNLDAFFSFNSISIVNSTTMRLLNAMECSHTFLPVAVLPQISTKIKTKISKMKNNFFRFFKQKKS